MIQARTVHYSVSLWFSLFILTSAVTGLLWAYAPYLYWQAGYKEKKSESMVTAAKAVKLSEASLQADEVLRIVATRENNGDSEVASLLLKSEAGILLYLARTHDKRTILIDAKSGAVLSPLNRELGARFAAQYVLDGAALQEIKNLSPWIDRKGAKFPSAWEVRFADPRKTHITINAESGEILEDSDVVRRFHFWIMKLHQFNYFGTHKILSAVSGVPLLFLIVTGLALAFRRLFFKRKGAGRATGATSPNPIKRA